MHEIKNGITRNWRDVKKMPKKSARSGSVFGAAIFFAVALTAPAGAQKILIDREPVRVAPYGDIVETSDVALYADEREYNRARRDRRYIFEKLTYASDGLEVVAYLMRPRRIAGPAPMVVFNRGSYIRNDAAPELIALMHRMAEAGFAVIAPMYRGSEGAGGRDEMGGADLNDLMAVAALADELPSAGASELFLYGESRGGMMVYQALRDGFPARAAATFGAPTDFFRLIEDSPEQYEPVADALWPGWREDRESVLGRRSAISWADQIGVPLLIMHGGADQSMPVTQSLSLASALDPLGMPFELLVFGYGNHVLTDDAAQRDARAAAWFRRHMPE